MLILLGILVAVTEAHSEQGQQEPILVHHPKVTRSSSSHLDDDSGAVGVEGSGAEAKAVSNQDMLYYVAIGMLVSQGLIRLLTFISNRREAAAAAAAGKNDGSRRGRRGPSLNDLEMDEEAKKRKEEYLAALSNNAELLPSDSDDDDYEEDSGSSSSDNASDLDDSDADPAEETVEDSIDNDNEGPRRRVIYADD